MVYPVAKTAHDFMVAVDANLSGCSGTCISLISNEFQHMNNGVHV